MSAGCGRTQCKVRQPAPPTSKHAVPAAPPDPTKPAPGPTPAWLTTSAAPRRCSASEGAKSKYSTASPLCRRPVRRLGGSSRRGRYSAL